MAGVDDVVTCLDRHHRCRAEAMLGLEVPRAAELLGLAGRTPASEFPCLVAPADGGSEGLDEPGARRKAAATCAAAIEKAALKFVRGGLAAVQKCADLVHGCVQRATDPSACLVKVRAACAKQQAKLTGAPKSIDAKLAAAVRKACDATKVGAADLLDPRGLGFAAHAARCAALGVPALTSATDVAACVTREHRCRTLQMLEVAVPRLDELLGLGALAP